MEALLYLHHSGILRVRVPLSAMDELSIAGVVSTFGVR